MLATIALLVAAVTQAPSKPQLVAYWPGNGNLVDSVSHETAHSMGGVVYVPGPFGKAFDFGGEASVIFIPDEKRFHITDALTVSCWVRVRTWPANGNSPGSQLVFRGDDRDGLDPYHLTVTRDKQWQWSICNDQNRGADLIVPATLGEWTHLCGTWDGSTGRMCLYVNGELAASTVTDVRPLDELDSHYYPGVSLGNVQNPYGPRHFQPLDGDLAEVKIYHGALAKPDFVMPK